MATDVLGRVIEVVSGEELDHFVREHITKPLGMVSTGFYVTETERDRIAQPDEDEATGQRILPALYSDNYIWLLPGETRQIIVSWRDTLRPAAPAVLVRGYNVPPVMSRS